MARSNEGRGTVTAALDAPIATDRPAVAEQLDGLASELAPRDAAVGTILERLAGAVRDGRHDETRGYADAIDPHAVAELLLESRSALWGVVEVARNVLVFAPIAVTWFGLSVASAAYGRLLEERPELVTRPFLLLWQEGFQGAAGVINFSTLAIIDASLIGLLIILTLTIHIRSDLRDVATRTRLLLKESQVRALLAHAVSVSLTGSLTDPDADAVLDAMVAEERRIYERAMEREQQLFDLEGTVRDLRQAAVELSRVAEALARIEAARATPTSDMPEPAKLR